MVYSGWPEAIADRATSYVSQATWNRLFRGRHRKRCKALAQIAAAFLEVEDTIHGILGSLASGLLASFGAGDAAQAFAEELVANIPLPMDAKIVAAARGVQVTGILLCVVNGDDLERCQCFIDLALELTKTQVKRLLVVAAYDWINLRPSRPGLRALLARRA
jgi:hypothetical protein